MSAHAQSTLQHTHTHNPYRLPSNLTLTRLARPLAPTPAPARPHAHTRRRMFPPVRVTFSLGEGACPGQPPAQPGAQAPDSRSRQHELQVNARDKYQVLMDILPYDNKRYRYAYHKSSWQQAGKADPPSPTKLFLHPDGPFTLDQLKRQVISFEKIKLTNNDANKHGYVSSSKALAAFGLLLAPP